MVHSFNAFCEVNLENELDGTGACIRRITALSARTNGAVFCPVRTHLFGLKHIGAAVCFKGRLIDIADRTQNPLSDEYETTDKLKVFAADGGKIGLLIDTDCLLEENWQKAAREADVILCLNRGTSAAAKDDAQHFSRTYAIPYLYVDDAGIEWRSM